MMPMKLKILIMYPLMLLNVFNLKGSMRKKWSPLECFMWIFYVILMYVCIFIYVCVSICVIHTYIHIILDYITVYIYLYNAHTYILKGYYIVD